jgi:hypothetical protein
MDVLAVWILPALVVCGGEALAWWGFPVMRRFLEITQETVTTRRSPEPRTVLIHAGDNAVLWIPRVKGIVERLMMLTGLLAGFPHVLIAFSALKIGTRLRPDSDDAISNTYFLIGNLVSMLLTIVYALIIKAFW